MVKKAANHVRGMRDRLSRYVGENNVVEGMIRTVMSSTEPVDLNDVCNVFDACLEFYSKYLLDKFHSKSHKSFFEFIKETSGSGYEGIVDAVCKSPGFYMAGYENGYFGVKVADGPCCLFCNVSARATFDSANSSKRSRNNFQLIFNRKKLDNFQKKSQIAGFDCSGESSRLNYQDVVGYFAHSILKVPHGIEELNKIYESLQAKTDDPLGIFCFSETNKLIERFLSAVNLSRLIKKPSANKFLEEYEVVEAIDSIVKYCLVQNAKIVSEGNLRVKLAFLLKFAAFNVVAVNDIMFDLEFLSDLHSLFGHFYKANSDDVLFLEKQYASAVRLARERWDAGDERPHWKMASDLIDEICGPIKKDIESKFDADFRLKDKKEKLSIKFESRLEDEIKKLEEDLQNKKDRLTMSLKELKSRLQSDAEERGMYHPEGGRTFGK